MAEFNPDLHQFLTENEVGMWTEKGELKFGVHVHFHDIARLAKLFGAYALSDGGMACILNSEWTIFVPLDEYFMDSNFTVNDYKHCFSEDDLKSYSSEIDAFDRD